MKAIKLGKLNAAPHEHVAPASAEHSTLEPRGEALEGTRRSVAERVRAAVIRAAVRKS